jgi:hypothetical protein
MPFELPLVTRREIARELRLERDVSDASALRNLKNKGALSAGVDVSVRGPSGRVHGRLHLYSALNRDAARAVRHGQAAIALKLCRAATAVERSAEMRRVTTALAGIGSIGSTAELARALSTPAITKDVVALQAKQARARTRFAKALAPVVLAGRVSSLDAVTAALALSGAARPLVLPRVTLDRAGLGQMGAAASATWEVLPDGRTLMSVEPAVDSPDLTDTGAPLADVYGTPWGRIVTNPDAVNIIGPPTVKIPDGIPDVA